MAYTHYDTVDGDPVWEHEQTGEQVVGEDIWTVANRDDWGFVWRCSECGERAKALPDEELIDAGFQALHVPCADDEDIEAANDLENAVQENYRAAKSAGF